MCVLLITRLLRGVGRWARKLFCGVVYVVVLPFWHFYWCRGFCHRTGSDLLLFVFISFVVYGSVKDTSGPDNFEVWVIYWQYIFDTYLWVRLNRDANCSFKNCINSASYEYRKMSTRRGARFVHIWMPTVCWKTFPGQRPRICCQLETHVSWWCNLRNTCS